MVLSILSPCTAVVQPLVCSKNKKYTFATDHNKDGIMELKAYSTKWEHSEPPTLRLKYTFWPEMKIFHRKKKSGEWRNSIDQICRGAVA